MSLLATAIAKTPQPPNRKPVGHPAADKLTDGLGMQGVVQDASRAAHVGLKTAGKSHRGLSALAEIAAGDRLALSHTLNAGLKGVGRAVRTVSPSQASQVVKAVAPALRGLGQVLHVAGKVGPIISIPFAGYDVAKAVTENDPAKQSAARGNAFFTVAGTVVGTAGIFIAAPVVAFPLLGLSAAIGIGQIIDAYRNDGRSQAAFWDRVVAPAWRALVP